MIDTNDQDFEERSIAREPKRMRAAEPVVLRITCYDIMRYENVTVIVVIALTITLLCALQEDDILQFVARVRLGKWKRSEPCHPNYRIRPIGSCVCSTQGNSEHVESSAVNE